MTKRGPCTCSDPFRVDPSCPWRNHASHAPKSLSDCPRKHKHTKCPEGYLEWHNWAEKKSKTHTQKRCHGCGLYAIWVPKKGQRT